MSPHFFPDFIRSLPMADIPLQGLQAWLFQGESQQFVFMEFSHDVEVPPHSHEAQWGVVLDGRIDLTIEGTTRSRGKGDSYSIAAGQTHGAKIHAGYKDLTFFNQKDRYSTK